MKYTEAFVKEVVKYCINQHKEGEYWDFKQEWHKKSEDLIKDIICFANTVHNKKCYIIFGVSDTFEIVGMEKPRKKQADIIDLISQLKFAGDNKPKVSLQTITLNNKILDVLIIDDIKYTPIYLKSPYGKMRQGCIYSRVKDRNTPDNENAEIEVIEMLWRKRFGLTKSAYEYIMDRLLNRLEWTQYRENFYNIYKPEYQISIYDNNSLGTEKSEFYAYNQCNSNVSYQYLDIVANNTILNTFQIVNLDGGRLSVPTPEWGHLYGINKTYTYKYYVINSDRYRILQFMYDSCILEQKSAYENLVQVVLIFYSENEKNEFENYVLGNIKILEKYTANNTNFDFILDLKSNTRIMDKERLQVGESLNKMLQEMRNSKLNNDCQ